MPALISDAWTLSCFPNFSMFGSARFSVMIWIDNCCLVWSSKCKNRGKTNNLLIISRVEWTHGSRSKSHLPSLEHPFHLKCSWETKMTDFCPPLDGPSAGLDCKRSKHCSEASFAEQNSCYILLFVRWTRVIAISPPPPSRLPPPPPPPFIETIRAKRNFESAASEPFNQTLISMTWLGNANCEEDTNILLGRRSIRISEPSSSSEMLCFRITNDPK